MTAFDPIERAIADIAAGKPVVVVDDADRENEGDLIFAAEMATPELVAFMVRYTSGYICVPLTEADCDRLDLPPMFHTNQDKRGTAYTVSVDARDGVSTGISAHDRATTMRALANPAATAEDFTRPGRTWYPTLGKTRFPLWGEVSTAYHEGVPGHHLQLAQLTYLSAEPAVDCGCALQVDPAAHSDSQPTRPVECLGHHIGGEGAVG